MNLIEMTNEAPIGRNWHTVLPDGIHVIDGQTVRIHKGRPEPIEDDAKTVQVPSLRRVLTSQERAWLNDYNTLVRTWAGIRWYAKLGVKATVPYYYATVAARFVGELPSKLAGERVQGAEVAN